MYRHFWILTLIGYGVGSVLTAVVVPLLYKRMMDVVSAGGVDALHELYRLFAGLVITIVVYNIFYRLGDYCIVQAQSRALKGITDHALEGLQRKSYRFYSNVFTGGLVAKVKRFVRAFEELTDQIVFQMWMHGISLVSTVLVLWYYSWVLGAFFFGWLVLYALLVRVMVQRTTPKFLANADADSEVTGHLSDIVTNILTVKMFGATKREQRNFETVTERQLVCMRAAWMQNSFWNNLFQGAMVNVFEIGIVAAVIVLWGMGVADAGLVLLVVVYVLRSFNIVWMISRNVIHISRALTDANEMVELLDEPADVNDVAAPERANMPYGHVVFSGVSHAYEGAGYVFNGLDLDIRAGEKVALVGHSGAGKTTIVKLLLRFLDIEAGHITIDGQDVTNVSQDDLRRHIAYVPQEPLLFHRTLRENIVYGKPDATHEEVEDVARRARAHDFIIALSHGYDTLVGERGVKLSGGERQRVAIARALLKNAPIVILDEATSSLDSISERFIQEAFDELMRERTTIVIAHRLSTIRHMDRIIVLERGGVAEQGTHAELLNQGGVYAALWHSQVGGFIADDSGHEDGTESLVTTEIL